MGGASRMAAVGALAAMVLGGTGQAAFASQAESGSIDGSGDVKRPVRSRSRVRTENEILATLIREGSERSATFRALLAAIDATDGLIYLTVGKCGRLRACLLHQMTVAGSNRVLTIVVNAQNDDVRLIAPIAHELWHALEILGDPGITTEAGITAFYRFHGIERQGVIETRAAITTGDAVRAEVRRSLRR